MDVVAGGVGEVVLRAPVVPGGTGIGVTGGALDLVQRRPTIQGSVLKKEAC